MGRTPDGTPPCTGADVLEIVGLLASAGVDVWVDGGRGIDALLGEQTRPHADLDLALPTRHWSTAQRVACMSAELQVRSHTGDDVDDDDWHDVRHLHERFGLPIPQDSARWTASAKRRDITS